MRSFSNLWYWIALAVTWSRMSHWVLGVPWDMVQRARRQGGEVEAQIEQLVAIHSARLGYIGGNAGLLLTGVASAGLTFLFLAGFVYAVEFCQALFLIALPLSLVGVLTLRAARRIEAAGVSGPELRRRLGHHRILVQLIGLVSIFVTAMWGMFQNMNMSVL